MDNTHNTLRVTCYCGKSFDHTFMGNENVVCPYCENICGRFIPNQLMVVNKKVKFRHLALEAGTHIYDYTYCQHCGTKVGNADLFCRMCGGGL